MNIGKLVPLSSPKVIALPALNLPVMAQLPLPVLATCDDLLPKMKTVLRFGGMWHARAQGSEKYAHGATPMEAMRNALATVAASK